MDTLDLFDSRPNTLIASDDPIDQVLVDEVTSAVNRLYAARYRRNSLPAAPSVTISTPPLAKWDTSVKQAVKRRTDCRASTQLALGCARRRTPCEDACAIIHNEWLTRNHKFATGLQKLAYTLLTEQEKDRYREVYRAAVEGYERRMTVSYIS